MYEPETADGVREVRMHDGSDVRFRALDADYDPTDRDRATVYRLQEAGEVVTGLPYLEPDSADEMHALNGTDACPLVDLPYDELCPDAAALKELMREFV